MTVRPATEADAPAISAVYDHHVLHTLATFDLVPPTPENRRAWLADHAGGRHRVLVAERDGEVVGFASSGRFRPRPAYDSTVETSVYLAPDAVGQGLGTALYTALLEALAGEDVHRALAVIAQPNEASVALHRSFGFTHVGTFGEVGHKFGRYVDVAWFQKNLSRSVWCEVSSHHTLRDPGRVDRSCATDRMRVGPDGAAGSRGIPALP